MAAFPNKNDLDLGVLEKMPYLKAVVMEAIRLSYGLSARNPRTHKTPLHYGDWVIPANTCIVRPCFPPLFLVHMMGDSRGFFSATNEEK